MASLEPVAFKPAKKGGQKSEGVLVIYGDYDELKVHTIADNGALYAFDRVRPGAHPEEVAEMVDACAMAMKRALRERKA